MRFWDSSALVPLFVAEPETSRAERWFREDRRVVVWVMTRVELLSALARRRRLEPDASETLTAKRRNLLEAWQEWSEVTAVEMVRHHAERIVEAHPLRAADALQVAAALVAAGGVPGRLDFVTFDERQAEAADREGFRVLGPA